MNLTTKSALFVTTVAVVMLTNACGGTELDLRPRAASPPVAATSAAAPAERVASRGEIGDMASDFELVDLSGRTVRLSDFRGKVVLVDFWATWCPPCRQEIPGFVSLHAKYSREDIEFVGISFDRSIDPVRQYASAAGIKYPVVMGTSDVSAAFGGVDAIPTTFVIGRDGRILWKHTGYGPPELFAGAIDAVL